MNGLVFYQECNNHGVEENMGSTLGDISARLLYVRFNSTYCSNDVIFSTQSSYYATTFNIGTVFQCGTV